MEQPLSVANLQKEYVHYLSNKFEPVDVVELSWQMRPYVVLHRVRITDSAFFFSAGIPILFSDISRFYVRAGTLNILLKTGYLCILSRQSSARRWVYVCNPDEYVRTIQTQLWWWVCVGNLKLFWWNIKDYLYRVLL